MSSELRVKCKEVERPIQSLGLLTRCPGQVYNSSIAKVTLSRKFEGLSTSATQKFRLRRPATAYISPDVQKSSFRSFSGLNYSSSIQANRVYCGQADSSGLYIMRSSGYSCFGVLICTSRVELMSMIIPVLSQG